MARLAGFKNFVLLSIVGLFGVLVLVLVVVAFQFWLFLRLPGSSYRDVHHLTIETGMNASAIAEMLHREGLITDARKFYILTRMRGAGNKLQAGEYAFAPTATPGQILDQLIEGKVFLHKMTVPEGSTVHEVAEAIERAGMASSREVMGLVRDQAFISELGLNVRTLEGYLFPETYHFAKSQNARSILRAMVDQFRLNFPEAWRERAERSGLSVHDVVILASIVEKEAVVQSERPVIAAVFLNRLKRNMPLQSDPTAVYDLPDFSGPITREHLKRKTPYNTYQTRGLPIGPICSPGASSLEAVVNPEKVGYLYFVSNNDGTHHFSSTLAEHLRAVSAYRKKINGSTRETDSVN